MGDRMVQCPGCGLISQRYEEGFHCEHCGLFNVKRWKDQTVFLRRNIFFFYPLVFGLPLGFVVYVLFNGSPVSDRIQSLLATISPALDKPSYASMVFVLGGLVVAFLGALIRVLADKSRDPIWKIPAQGKEIRERWNHSRQAVIAGILDKKGPDKVRISALEYVKDDRARLRALLLRDTSNEFRMHLLNQLTDDVELMTTLALSDPSEIIRAAAVPHMSRDSLKEAMSKAPTDRIEKALRGRLGELGDSTRQLLNSPIRNVYKTELIKRIKGLDELADLKETISDPAIQSEIDARIATLRREQAAAQRAARSTPGVVFFKAEGQDAMGSMMMIRLFAMETGNNHLVWDSVPKLTSPIFSEASTEDSVKLMYKTIAQMQNWWPIEPQVKIETKDGVPVWAFAYPALADVSF